MVLQREITDTFNVFTELQRRRRDYSMYSAVVTILLQFVSSNAGYQLILSNLRKVYSNIVLQQTHSTILGVAMILWVQ